MRVLIVVTHLLGTGHLRRAATLARAFAGAGHETVLASGGFPVPGVDMGAARFEQLPFVASDGVDFTRLLGAGGGPVVAGGSALVGLIGPMGVAATPRLREAIGSHEHSRAVVFGWQVA